MMSSIVEDNRASKTSLPTFQSNLSYYLLAVGTAVNFVLLAILNALTTQGYFGRGSNSVVSARHETIITPAGYAFSIWGVIFFFQACYAVLLLLPVLRGATRTYVRYTGIFINLTWVFEYCWLFAFTSESMWVSWVLILGAFLSLATAHWLLYQTAKEQDTLWYSLSLPKRALLYATFWLPTSLNFGWVTAATLVQTAISISTEVAFPRAAAIVFLGIALLCGLAVGISGRDVVYPLAVAWALTAIAVKQMDNAIVITAAVAAAVLAASALAVLVMNIISTHHRQKHDAAPPLWPQQAI